MMTVKCNTEGEKDSSHSFTFDRVFGQNCTQQEIFEEVAIPSVDGVLNGYNGTIFAYGQTGSGKSFTMEGGSLYDQETKGLIPRMFEYLFQRIQASDPAIEFSIKCSYLEIYMEKIMDLLDAKKTNLQVKDDKTRGIYIADATEVYVSCPEEMYQVMKSGQMNRSVAATRMNAVSSRSHSIFLVTVLQKNTETDTSKLGKLYCCDLAGSEKIGKTEATGQTLEEAKMINKSLSALGNVINALTESKKGGFVPYRDSKLTRILQESLGGNSCTCLVITASYSQYNDKETLSTLRFGTRAKTIKNKVKQNAERSSKELLQCLANADAKVQNLTDLVQLIQARLKQTIAENHENKSFQSLADQAMEIAAAKDLDVLVARLRGDRADIMLQALEDDSTISSAVTTSTQDTTMHDSGFITAVSETKKTDGKDDLKAKVFKQHIELQKLREQLEQAVQEQHVLREEVRSRNQEIYQMSEKIIMMEFNGTNLDDPIAKQNNLQDKYDKLLDLNVRRVTDLQKLRRGLDRLKSDLQVFQLSKRLKAKANGQEQDDSGDTMLNEQIALTMEMIVKIEVSLAADLLSQSERQPRRRSVGSKLRSRSKIELLRLDQTIVTEMEYLNLLPDMSLMSRYQDVNESSFLKSMPTINESERIVQLQEQLDQHKKQIEEYEQRSSRSGAQESSSSQKDFDNYKKEKESEIASLKALVADMKREKEMQLIALKTQHIQELQQMHAVVDQDLDKRQHYEMLSNYKLLEEKNRHLVSEVIQTRRQLSEKETSLAQAEQKLMQSEKSLALQKIKKEQVLGAGLVPVNNAGVLQFQQLGQSTNQLDLVFNRKVVKPIRGGGQMMPNQVTFEQFAGSAIIPQGRLSIGGRSSVPVVPPQLQQEFKNQILNMKQMQEETKQIIQKQKMVDAFEMANIPLDETLMTDESNRESDPAPEQRPSQPERASNPGKVYGGGKPILPEQIKPKKRGFFSGLKKLF